MANKAIKQYSQTTDIQSDDALLVQRNNTYFYVEHSDLGFGLKRATVTLSSINITNLFTTDIEIVAAAGAGIYLIPVRAYAKRNAGTAYATEDEIRIGYSGRATDADYLLRWQNILTTTADTVRTADETNLYLEDMEANDALVVYAPNANPTGGDGTVEVVLYYEQRAI